MIVKETETPNYVHLIFNLLLILTENFFKGKCMVQWKQLVLTLTVHLQNKKKKGGGGGEGGNYNFQ